MNQKSLFTAVFVSTLALTTVACDDDPKPSRDAAVDRAPDTTTTDTMADRTPDTTTTDTMADRAPDTVTPDAGVDRAPDATDAPVDAPADMADAAVDRAPDLAVDLPIDTTGDTVGAVNGCVAYVDATAPAHGRTLIWDLTIATSPTRCMTVKVGQTVAWAGSFATHPLTASGGNTPNPIPNYSTGFHGTVTFNTAGTFGYRCTVHPVMTGAIQVVP